jgi:predicted RNA-binding protein YlqC (UPF0109 family)
LSAPRDEYAADAAADPAVEPAGLPQGDELTIGQERVLELVSYVVVNLVSHPADVTVDILHRQDRDVYQVKVHPEDLGRVIGKGGQTARALRVLLTAVSARTDQRIGLDIVE